MSTNAAVVTSAPASPPAVDQLSLPTIVALHLLPGALVTAAYVALAPVIEGVGYPPIASLLAAIALVLVPFELGVVLWAGRGGQAGMMAAVPYRRALPRRDWLRLVPTLIVLAFLGFGLHAAIEAPLIDGFFGWLPDWFVQPIMVDRIGDYAAATWLVTLAAYLVLNGFVGPIVEELYFRGYLLPRMERMGRWAPLVNVVLFSLYHFWSPWQFLARVLGFGPTVYVVHRRRNVYLGMVVHCGLNTLGVILVAGLVLGRL